MHFGNGQLAAPLVFPLSILTEGHTGVAVFMTLSGYLFSKLLDGKDYSFHKFMWNRAIRLFPLLIFVSALVAIQKSLAGTLSVEYFENLLAGFILPLWPNGGWSIAVELHFYLMLPFLLYLARRSRFFIAILILLPICARALLYTINGEVQSLAYWTILGRFDQFFIGILAYHYRDQFTGRHIRVGLIAAFFLIFWYLFDAFGGYYSSPAYPSPYPTWVVLTTIEGFSYAALIAWYDNSFEHKESSLSKFIAVIGTYSYSIYLLHVFFVFRIPKAIDRYLFKIESEYVLLALSIPAFLAILPIMYLSYNFVEKPFLRLRTPYLKRH